LVRRHRDGRNHRNHPHEGPAPCAVAGDRVGTGAGLFRTNRAPDRYRRLCGDAFFHYTFLTDRRLEWAVELLGGLPPTAGAANRLAIEGAVGYSSGISLVDLRTGPGVAALARALAWGTLAIEALVALAFLAPLRPPWATRVRAVVLAAFILGTYAIAPVIGFGWMLLILGLAQWPDGPDRGPIPALYLALFLVLPLYQTPWHELLSYLG
jgi:hypothetical protein